MRSIGGQFCVVILIALINAVAFSGYAAVDIFVLNPGKRGMSAGDELSVCFGAAGILSLVVGLCIGVPLAALLRKVHITNLPTFLFVGAGTGAVLAEVLLGGPAKRGLEFVWIAMILGALSAAIWWLLIERDYVRN